MLGKSKSWVKEVADGIKKASLLTKFIKNLPHANYLSQSSPFDIQIM